MPGLSEVNIDNVDQEIDDRIAAIPAERWAALMELADRALSRPPGQWAGGERTGTTEDGHDIVAMPRFSLSADLGILMKELYELDLVFLYDWQSWIGGRDPAEISVGDVHTALRLLIAVLRADRFVEGLLGGWAESGRLAEIFGVLASARPQG